MIIALAFLAYVLSFALLYAIRYYLTKNKLFSGDSFFHLSIGSHIRENNWKFPSSLKNAVFFESDKNFSYLTYPPLLHYITAIMPARYRLKMAKNFNIAVVSVLGSLAAAITFSITANIFSAILSALIVVINLSAFDLITQFSPRPMGLLFFSLIVCIVIFFPPNWISLLSLSFLVALITLTHKFAFQALVLGFLPYVILFGQPIFALTLVFGLIISIGVSRGFYLKILREHIAWLRFYNFKRKFSLTADLAQILARNSWYIALLVLLIFALNSGIIQGMDFGAKIIYWAVINLVIALIVMIPNLTLIGEYYRYIEYSLLPVGVAVGLFFDASNYIFITALFVGLFICLMALFRYKRFIVNSKMLVNPTDVSLYVSLKENCPGNFLVFPGIRTLEVNYFSGLDVVHLVRGHAISGSLKQIIESYNVSYVLKFKGSDPNSLFEKLKKTISINRILDSDNFEVYSLLQSN